ncbi:MAG: DEAD/DEAH box helicase [Acidobacteria bacterium]|nr:DEAD/DEAH box helicase [Acidobacteriota bacterium]
MPFSSLKLDPTLLKAIKELGYTRPTPVQAEAIPPALAGQDILACAMTGSGKTAAFLLPVISGLIGRPRKTTRALVLTPTRELAVQILEALNDLAVHTPVTGAAIIGGLGMGPQEHAFRSGVDVLIATPGRLLDHTRHPYAKLAGLEYLVLDEADRMLDMGFLPDIRRILRLLPTRRQTLFFSATMPAPILSLAHELLRSPATIQLERKQAPAIGITHAVYPVQQHLKSALLVALLQRGDIQDALVFTRTKHRANRLADYLVQRGVSAERIHGNRSQGQRTAALAGFKSGRHRVLVATDIAARGIDVQELGHVVNFDVPKVPDDYIHRVGRTGRADAVGDAFTFVSREDEPDLRRIEQAIGKRLPRVTVPDFDYNAVAKERLEIPLAERLAAMRAARRPRGQSGPRTNARPGHGVSSHARPGWPGRGPLAPGGPRPGPSGSGGPSRHPGGRGRQR